MKRYSFLALTTLAALFSPSESKSLAGYNDVQAGATASLDINVLI